MLTSNDRLPLCYLLTTDLAIMSLTLAELNLLLLRFAHAVPLLADVAYDVSHSPGWVLLLEVLFSALDVVDEGGDAFAFYNGVFIASKSFSLP